MKPKAVLIDIIDPETPQKEADNRLEELESLVNTFGGIVVFKTIQRRSLPDYDTFIGKGKLNELIKLIENYHIGLIIINNLLKSRQLFKINEKLREFDCQAWDRVDLILKIFSKHAQTTEARLQIELAGIKHMGPRIFDMGIELSRQAGAIGLRAGQGESNIEMMKRHLQKQEISVKEKLRHYQKVRAGHRQHRKRRNLKTAALVGYTNAGKSSLLNALTGKRAYVADKLFATLDTRIGKVFIPGEQNNHQYNPGKEILISDTIGFIRDLPPSLIEAFKSTLAETIDADLILHVIDISDPRYESKIKVVNKILQQLGLKDKPQIYVFNKLDKIPDPRKIQKLREKSAEKRASLMQAGKKTAEILGWVAQEKYEEEMKKGKIHKISPQILQRKYKSHNPVFISAAQKLNLNQLTRQIQQLL